MIFSHRLTLIPLISSTCYPSMYKLRMRIESEGWYELIGYLSEMFRDVKEDSLKILLESRR